MKPLKTARLLLQKWRRRSASERFLLVEAFLLLGTARAAVLLLPFRWLARTLGTPMTETERSAEIEVEAKARQIGSAVRSAATYTPWESVCLPQAVAGQWMLERRGIPGTVYLGVEKDSNSPAQLAAHAWLRCGNAILTGRAGMSRFTVVGTFSAVQKLIR